MAMMTLAVSGLSNCGLDLLAPVGTIYTIGFWAWSATQPSIQAVAIRTVRGERVKVVPFFGEGFTVSDGETEKCEDRLQASWTMMD